MSSPMITYDIPSTRGQWSADTWKACAISLPFDFRLRTHRQCVYRLAFNHKQTPYKTTWLTYLEIEPPLKSLGGAPTAKRPDTNADLYTLPTLSIDDEVVTDSDSILELLDAAFLETPRLFPSGTRALRAAVNALFLARVFEPSKRVLLPGIPDVILDAASADYYRTTRWSWYGSPLAEWSPAGTALLAQNWKAVHDGWTSVAGTYGKRESDGPWRSQRLRHAVVKP